MEEWQKLCEQAAREHDPEKLMELTQKITELLDLKCTTLKRHEPGSRDDPPPKTSNGDPA
jgi:hypothetical protein